MKKISLYTLAILIIVFVFGYFYLTNSNNFKRTGSFEITSNKAPIQIHRDEHGIAYVIADNKEDLYRGQGFVMAQDRLFQIEFYRAIIRGEAAEIVGSSMLDSDIQMRVLDLMGNARRSFQYLDTETKAILDQYCEGYNNYLEVAQDEFPVELSLLGMEPSLLSPVDIVAVTHFVGFFHAQNLEDEVLHLNLSQTPEAFQELFPLAINLDRNKQLSYERKTDALNPQHAKGIGYKKPKAPFLPYPELGSNNWAVSGKKTLTGKPLLANDPHIDARILPGLFYTIGLICPEFKAVGIATPGVPGILSGRNEFVAFGVTNAYGDSQDLYIETLKGQNYYEGDQAFPLRIREEHINIKDSTPVDISIRHTARGPIVSDFEAFNILTDDAVSLRWSLAETKSSSLGIERLLESRNTREFIEHLKSMDNMFFNYAIADTQGNIAHQATGLVPTRRDYRGATPTAVDTLEVWTGFIPKDSLPHRINPERGWIGTANHDTRPDDYPYYYSNHFSPYYRYQRISELLGSNNNITADDFWTYIFDVKNTQAEVLTPLFIAALKQNKTTTSLASHLEDWDFKDEVDSVGAAVFNVLYNELVYLLLNDELPNAVEDQFWENVYFWNQRIDQMILTDSKYIDNQETPQVEKLADLIIEAGVKTDSLLTQRLGKNPKKWLWGDLHTVAFVSPLRREGFGKNLLGAETFPKAGSNQTLNRGGFVKNTEREFNTSWFSSYRMVADLNDDEKIKAVISGGSAARVFHPYYKSQLDTWASGKWIPYWLKKEQIEKHSQYLLTLE